MTIAMKKLVYAVREGCPVHSWPEELLRKHDISVHGFDSAADCLEAVRECPCVLLIVGLDSEPEAGLRLLIQSSHMHPVMLSSAVVDKGDVHMAVRAMKAGARDCVERQPGREWWFPAIEKAASQWNKAQLPSTKPLTETEQFVLKQVLVGRTSKEIAWMLHRSPRTVEVHRTHIIQKLGVSSTVDLIRQAVSMELQDSLSSR